MFQYQLLFLFSISAMILGTVGDQFHLISKTLSYPDHYWAYLPNHQPYWVPFLMAGAGAGFYMMFSFFNNDQFWLKAQPSLKRGGLYVAIYFTLHMISGYLAPLWAIFIIYMIVLLLILFNRNIKTLLIATIFSILGGLTEVLLVHFSVFFYTNKHILYFDVPIWLFGLYFVAALGLINISGKLKHNFFNKVNLQS